MTDYPPSLPQVNQIAPVPRRIRAMLGGQVVLDTTEARYVWEWPHYPQFYVPLTDVDTSLLVDESTAEAGSRGTAHRYGLRLDDRTRPGAAWLYRDDALPGLAGTARFDWAALDTWYEEDEQVFLHPRDPYTRVDALRSTRHIRIEIDGAVLGESSAPVLVFETGLPTRYYLNRTEVDFTHLTPTTTETVCPYKGVTSGYWSAEVGDSVHSDIAWSYDFPTRGLQPVAGLIGFYNEKLDLTLDGTRLERPLTHFS